jgi:Utp11 protein
MLNTSILHSPKLEHTWVSWRKRKTIAKGPSKLTSPVISFACFIECIRFHRDFNNKKAALKGLHRRVLNKNPDEFYFHMIRSRMEDGEHIDTPKEEECTPEQLKLMQTQDLKYIAHKRLVESRKIDKLQSQLHLIDAEKPNNHVFFVDTKEEGSTLNLSLVKMIKYFFVIVCS